MANEEDVNNHNDKNEKEEDMSTSSLAAVAAARQAHAPATQALGVGLVAAYSFIATLIIGFAIEKTIGFRVSREVEIEGIDLKEHAESAYELASSSRGGASL